MAVVRCSLPNPADPSSGLKLFSNGVIQPLGNAIAPQDWTPPTKWTDTSARDMCIIDFTTPSGYVMSSRGTIFGFGAVVPATNFQDTGSFATMRKLIANPAGNGTGYQIDVRGIWYAYGTPRPANIGGPLVLVASAQAGGIDWGADIFADAVMDYPSKRWAMLSTAGHVVSNPFTVTMTTPVRTLTLNESMYRALAFQVANFPPGSTGGYIARRDGALFPFDSPQYTPAMAIGRFPNQDVVVDLSVLSNGIGGNPLQLEEATSDGRRAPVTVSTPPTIVVSVAPFSSGTTVSTTTKPTASITYTDPEGDAMAKSVYRWFPSATYGAGGFDPATSVAFDETTVTDRNVFQAQTNKDLANGTWRAYVRATDAAGDVSAWAFKQFTMSVTVPPTPAVTAALPDSGTWTTSVTVTAGGGTAAGFSARCEFSDDGGATWDTLADPVPYPASGPKVVTIADIEAPFNRSRSYRALTVNDLLSSAASSGVTAVLQSDDWVLTDPTTGVGGDVEAIPEWGHHRPSGGTALHAVGRKNAIVSRTAAGVGGREFALTVRTRNHAQFDALETLVDPGRTLQLRNPFGESLYVGIVEDIDTSLVEVAGSEFEITELGYFHHTVLQVVQVDRP
jgi:hypothetical protein